MCYKEIFSALKYGYNKWGKMLLKKTIFVNLQFKLINN
jgi:hypothetical protein